MASNLKSFPRFAAILIASLTAWHVAVPAQTGRPAARDGEWTAYHGNTRGHHYSPLSQIDASNFSSLEVAWRFKTDRLGPVPEYKLEGTPLMVNGTVYTTAGTRRAVVALDAATGELRWIYSLPEGARGAASPRQLSGRGVAYWSDGRDERIFYVTTGYRLVALDAKTGRPVGAFGTDGSVDLKRFAVFGNRQPIDLVNGEIGLHATPAVANDVVLVGSAFREGNTPKTHNNTKGMVTAFDAQNRQAAVDVQYDSAARRGGQRHLAERFLGGQRQHRRVESDQRGRRARARLPAGRIADRRSLRRPSSGQQPVFRQPGRRRSQDRRAQVALPAGSPHHLELRYFDGADPRRHRGQRPADQGRLDHVEVRVHLRLRSRHRSAGLADRGARGSERRRARRMVFADAAVSDEAARLRSTGAHGGRADRLHAGVARRSGQDRVALQARTHLHAAGRQPRRRTARDAQAVGRHELARRRLRSTDAHAFHELRSARQRRDRTDSVAGQRCLRHELRQRQRDYRVPLRRRPGRGRRRRRGDRAEAGRMRRRNRRRKARC